MTTPGEAAQAAIAWELEQQAACLSIARARADRADQAEAERREAERDRTHTDADLQAFLAAKTGRVALSPLEAIAKHQAQAPAERDGPGRDPGAAYGGRDRPAVLVGTTDGALLDIGGRQVQRSASRAQDDALLERAKAMSADSFMQIQVARFHQRQGREVSRSRPFVSRSDAVACQECLQAGASAEESARIHSSPQAYPVIAR